MYKTEAAIPLLRSAAVRATRVIHRLPIQSTAGDAEFMDKQKLKEDLGGQLWNDLKQAIAAECDKNNVRFTETDEDNISLQDGKDGRKISSLVYERTVPCVAFHTPTRRGVLDIGVGSDGASVEWLAHEEVHQPGDIAIKFVRGLSDS